jgi:peptidoglycan/LPS O-acetylase OafA/YrhL
MTRPQDSLTQLHYDCLDGLRAVLALYVVMHHAWLGVFTADPAAVSRGYSFLAFGRYSVCFFIVLSGFCLMLPTLKSGFTLARGLGGFLQRRAWRILPPYYFALLLSALLDGPINHLRAGLASMILPVSPHNLLTHVLLVHNFVPNDMYKINGAFWSIPIEWQIYFVFPLLLWGWRVIGPVPATLAAALVSLVLENELQRRFQIQPCAHFIGLFSLGMWAAHVSTSARYRDVPWRTITALGWVVFAVSFHYHDQAKADLIFGFVASMTLVVIFLYPAGLLHRALNWKPLVFVGAFSYSIYLVHAPLLILFWFYVFSPLRAHPNLLCAALIVIGVPVIVALSYLFHLGCEKPFLQIRARKAIHVT